VPKHRRKLPAWLDQPLYLAIRGAIAAAGVVSVNDAVRSARALGRTFASFEPKRVRRAMDALLVAFPNMPEDQRHDYALLAYEHLFTLGIEMAFTPRLITPDSWSDRVRMGALDAAVRELVKSRPCVMITGHCGNWELLGYTMALIGFPMYALYRPLDLKPLDTWLRSTRERQGLVLLDKFGAAERMPEIMHRNALAAFIADQNAGDRGLFVPFFGRLASTYKSIGLLAIQYNAPIICGQARRLTHHRDPVHSGGWNGDAFHYSLDTVDVIMPEDWIGQPDPLFYVSARYRRALEDMVRRAPEQNLWLHRYWKSRPRHEHAGKPFPSSLREKLKALPWMTSDELARIEDWSARDSKALADAPPKPAQVAEPAPA
jgi:Kdo2-lipid IVA lauroyltransferase/acyltransferase